MFNKRKVLLLVLVGIVAGAAFGYYQYNKPHKDMAKTKAAYSMDSKALFAAFEADEMAANEKYLGKIIEVNGTIQDLQMEGENQKIIMEGDGMMFGVICNLDELRDDHRTDFKTGEEIKLKCECTGLLMDVVMKRCIEIK